MTRTSAVRVDDDLASGQSRIGGWPAEHKAAGWVHEVLRIVVQQFRRDYAVGQWNQVVFDRRLEHFSAVLRAHQHRVDAPGSVVRVVLDGHLGLAVGAEIREPAGLPLRRHLARDAVRQRDGQRHQLRRLPHRVADHHSLVACAYLMRALFAPHFQRNIDAVPDVRRLLLDRYEHAGRFGIESVLWRGVSDVPDDFPRHRGDVHISGGRDLAEHEHYARRTSRLACDPCLGILGEDGVQHPVRYLVAQLVRVPFRHGLRGQQVRAWRHSCVLRAGASLWFKLVTAGVRARPVALRRPVHGPTWVCFYRPGAPSSCFDAGRIASPVADASLRPFSSDNSAARRQPRGVFSTTLANTSSGSATGTGR